MICSKAIQNVSVVHSVFRRVQLGDFRGSLNNFHLNCSICPKRDQECFSEHCVLSRNLTLLKGVHIRAMASSEITGSSSSTSKESNIGLKTNRLALEKSPYLLQHATNPVDWYPWGQEAFDKAKKENKLIFLSVGYSTCHWCHVMEKESFENETVAELMNKHYINIKVDREERPDVDKLYMSFVQATVGGGGWPMSVFLTPSLEPLVGGTYFPPEDKYGRPGFKTILLDIAEQWDKKTSTILSSGKFALEALRKVSERDLVSKESNAIPGVKSWQKCFQQFNRHYDEVYGGFSTSPKFPQPSNFNFLFHLYSRDKENATQCLEMCLNTLKKMSYGGIHDHVNSGFARYSVDQKWHVPHFEKMLYDQAQLAVSFCDAYVVTKDEFYSDVVHDILTYVSRDLSHELGGFYGAEDADSYPHHGAKEKKEGAFCVWEYEEISNFIGSETTKTVSHLDLFCFHYSVKEGGNVLPSLDPHQELKRKNVLSCFGSYETTAAKFDTTVKEVKRILKKCHEILSKERQRRPKPGVDTKMVTSWNGLMMSGFAKAGFALKDQRYINRAILAANFVRKFLYDEKSKTLLRCCYRGDNNNIVQTSVPIPGFLDDYAFLIRGLLDLYEASLDADWLQWAECLQEQQDRQFWDTSGSGYFTSPVGDESILIRGKEDQDGAEPCGNSVAVNNLLRLAAYLDRSDLRSKAGKTLSAFSNTLESFPMALPEMMSALLLYHNSPTQVFIAGETGDNKTEALLDVVRSKFLPGRILAITDGPGGRAGLLYRRHESLSRLTPINGKPAAYVCRNFACSLPVTEPQELAESLESGINDTLHCQKQKAGPSGRTNFSVDESSLPSSDENEGNKY